MVGTIPPSANLAYNAHYPVPCGRQPRPRGVKGVYLKCTTLNFLPTKKSRACLPWMLINCPSLSAAPLIFVSLATKRLTLGSVNINEPPCCDDSSLDTDLRRISDAAPYPREAARPVAMSDLCGWITCERIYRHSGTTDRSWMKGFWMTSVV